MHLNVKPVSVGRPKYTSSPWQDSSLCESSCDSKKCMVQTVSYKIIFTAEPITKKVEGYNFENFDAAKLKEIYPNACNCEVNAILDFVRGTLLDHENEHVAIYNEFSGVVTGKEDFYACGNGAERNKSVRAQMEVFSNNLFQNRRDSTDARSAALDDPEFNPPIEGLGACSQ